jgi:hypothetical protein
MLKSKSTKSKKSSDTFEKRTFGGSPSDLQTFDLPLTAMSPDIFLNLRWREIVISTYCNCAQNSRQTEGFLDYGKFKASTEGHKVVVHFLKTVL